MPDWKSEFTGALSYEAFLTSHGSDSDIKRWSEVLGQFELSEPQRALLGTFVREMNVLCLAGAWCGDCVGQCPILEQIARGCPRINLRFLDRDKHPAVAEELKVCGGARVPVVVFLSEDFAECARYGDRTLSRYRAMAAELGGAACSTGIQSAASLNQVADDWLREFERVQLMLRVSPRLRKIYGD